MPVVSLFSSSNDKPSPFTQAFLFTVIKNVSYYGNLQQQFFPYKDVELNNRSQSPCGDLSGGLFFFFGNNVFQASLNGFK